MLKDRTIAMMIKWKSSFYDFFLGGFGICAKYYWMSLYTEDHTNNIQDYLIFPITEFAVVCFWLRNHISTVKGIFGDLLFMNSLRIILSPYSITNQSLQWCCATVMFSRQNFDPIVERGRTSKTQLLLKQAIIRNPDLFLEIESIPLHWALSKCVHHNYAMSSAIVGFVCGIWFWTLLFVY